MHHLGDQPNNQPSHPRPGNRCPARSQLLNYLLLESRSPLARRPAFASKKHFYLTSSFLRSRIIHHTRSKIINLPSLTLQHLYSLSLSLFLSLPISLSLFLTRKEKVLRSNEVEVRKKNIYIYIHTHRRILYIYIFVRTVVATNENELLQHRHPSCNTR